MIERKILNFFIKHKTINHILLIIIFVFGIYSYIKIPKEVFPNLETENILVEGSYPGASAEVINKAIVNDLENSFKSISGIKKIHSYIRVGYYYIVLDIAKSSKKNTILNEVRDSINTFRANLPPEVDLPTASVRVKKSRVITFTLQSNDLDRYEMKNLKDDIESEILSLKNINGMDTYGIDKDSLLININHLKVRALGINNEMLEQYISKLSFIYPVGTIDKSNNKVFVTTNNKNNVNTWLNARLNIDGKIFYLRDVATVKKGVVDDKIITRVNGKKNIFISVSKGDHGNVITLSQKIKNILNKEQKKRKNFKYSVIYDGSKVVSSRLNLIISSIILSIILVGVIISLFMSVRASLLVLVGIPTAFLMGISILYLLGYSLTIMTLLAMFITVGILVDDAIVVSENIERRLENGMEVNESIYEGTLKLVKPILITMLTTIFAFLPMLYAKGGLGTLINPIPVVVSVFLFASFIESFVFLPIHALDFLKPKNKVRISLEPCLKIYEKLLRFCNKYKKSFLISTICIIIGGAGLLFHFMSYSFMPRVDSDTLYYSLKFPNKYTLEDTNGISKKYEQILLSHKKELEYNDVRVVVGYIKNSQTKRGVNESGITIIINLKPYTVDNFFYKYILPVLNLNFNFSNRRLIPSEIINSKVINLFKKLNEKYDIEEFNTNKNGSAKLVDHDIELNFSYRNLDILRKNILKLSNSISKMKGVITVGTNIEKGTKEFKFTINSYGESLGLTEEYVSKMLRSYFSNARSAQMIGSDGSINVVVKSSYKNAMDEFDNFPIPLPGTNESVRFSDIAKVSHYKGLSKIDKLNSNIFFSLYADLDGSVTANKILDKIKPKLDDIKNQGKTIKYLGEREQNREFFSEFLVVFIVAIVIILFLLYSMFKSIFDIFIIISVAFLSSFGVLLFHIILGVDLYITSFIGYIGLFGVVVNDGIIMLEYIKKAKDIDSFLHLAKLRFRPIMLTTITTFLGMATLIFLPSGQGIIMQPLAISLGFGLLFGTLLNLFYLPILYTFKKKI